MRIKLAHGPIKSLGWPGMVMGFNITKVALLGDLKKGAAIRLELGKTREKKVVRTA